MRFTVFTPTYNRAHTLPRLYESLSHQTLTDFEWVVVDDGSTDDTAALLQEFASRSHRFPIRVLTTPNGGKHRAINAGVSVAHGDLFFIVDSDDHLPENALAVLNAVERSIPPHKRAEFAGVCGLKGYPDGRPIGTTFPGDALDITTLERGDHGISGDKAEVVYTDVMRAYPFPEFPGERFLPEAVVWDRIAYDTLKLRYFNEIVYTADYLEDGLTQRYQVLLHENPRGQALHLRQRHRYSHYSQRAAMGQCLEYFDEHKADLPIRDIAQNLGLSLMRLQAWRVMRRAHRFVFQKKGRHDDQLRRSPSRPSGKAQHPELAMKDHEQLPDGTRMASSVERDPEVNRSNASIISVIVPVYNTAAYLADCIDSLLNQTYSNLDVILINDGSTDDSAALCDGYAAADSRVRVIHQGNAGLSEARNVGLDHAAGALVMFLDSDDWLELDCLEILHELLVHEQAQVALCGTRSVRSADETDRVRFGVEGTLTSGEAFLRDSGAFAPVHPVSAWGKLYALDLWKGVRFPSGRLHEDIYVTHRVLHRATRLTVTNQVLHFYRQRPGSITSGTMSLTSAADKAGAHLERAVDLSTFGLTEVAALELRRAVGWHLRAVAAADRTPSTAPEAVRQELTAQRERLVRLSSRSRMGLRMRMLLRAYTIAPGAVARLYATSLRRRGGGTHAIKGERGPE